MLMRCVSYLPTQWRSRCYKIFPQVVFLWDKFQIEVRDSPNRIFHPCALWDRGLARWESCRRVFAVAVGVTWKSPGSITLTVLVFGPESVSYSARNPRPIQSFFGVRPFWNHTKKPAFNDILYTSVFPGTCSQNGFFPYYAYHTHDPAAHPGTQSISSGTQSTAV